MLFIIAFIVLTVICVSIADKRYIGWKWALFFSIALSPIVSLLIVLGSAKKVKGFNKPIYNRSIFNTTMRWLFIIVGAVIVIIGVFSMAEFFIIMIEIFIGVGFIGLGIYFLGLDLKADRLKKYIPLFVISFLFLVLLILFFWQENLDLSLPINSDKFGQFGTMLGSLLTALTVYLLYRQISEMIADRKAANQPDLFPVETKFETEDIQTLSFSSAAEQNLPLPTFYRITNGARAEEQSLNINLHNIGLGVAKEIRIRWLYDKNKIETLLQNVYNGLKTSSDDEFLDFIPAQNFSDISLPYYFMQTCGIKLNASAMDLFETAPRSKPDLMLKIDFKDIYDNQHEREFKINLDCSEKIVVVKFKRILSLIRSG
jgi:hypothetical protein